VIVNGKHDLVELNCLFAGDTLIWPRW